MSFSLKYHIKVVNNRLQNTLFDFAILYERSVSNLFLLSHLIVFVAVCLWSKVNLLLALCRTHLISITSLLLL